MLVARTLAGHAAAWILSLAVFTLLWGLAFALVFGLPIWLIVR